MKKSIIGFAVLTSGVALFSTVAYAATVDGGIDSLATLVTTVNNKLLTALSTLFMSAALVAFFYGVVQYIWGAREGNDTKIKAGNNFMLWGVIALFIMFSIYGFITFGQKILFPGQPMDTITIPKLNVGSGGGAEATTPPTQETNPLLPQPVGYCSDGTAYYSSSERNLCPPANNAQQGGTLQPVGYCSDGTAYYSSSERNLCPPANNAQ